MKVLLVDDHALTSEGMAYVLQRHHPQVKALFAGSLGQALALLETEQPISLILLDLMLEDARGLDGLTRLRQDYAHIPVVVVSGRADIETVTAALEAGAMGYIPKSTPIDVLAGALGLVFSGGVYVPPLVLQDKRLAAPAKAVDELELPAAPAATALDVLSLSPRDRDVLALLIQGHSNKIIARQLNVSDHTVRKHVTIVLRALRVRTRTQAVFEAARLGLQFPLPGGSRSPN